MRIVVLSDGRPGHFNQSLGIAERVPEAQVELIEMSFESRVRDTALRLLGAVLGILPIPSAVMRLALTWALTRESIECLRAAEPDVVISAGSSMAAPNLLFGRSRAAMTVACGVPSLVGARSFDLIFAPEHKNPPSRSSVVPVRGVPNRVCDEMIAAETVRWRERDELRGGLGAPLLGILFGGPVRNWRMSEDLVTELLAECRAHLSKTDGEVIVATSRRTPERIEEIISAELGNEPHCRLILFAGEEPGNPVPMMAGLCDVVIASADSATMLSELAGGSARILAWGLERESFGSVSSDTKLAPFLAKRDHLRFLTAGEVRTEGRLRAELEELLQESEERAPLREAERCAGELKSRYLSRLGEGRAAVDEDPAS